MEVVYNLTAQKFLNAFKRFNARREKPTKMISDNATTLKLAKKGFAELWKVLYSKNDSINYFSNKIFSGTLLLNMLLERVDSMRE